MNNPYYNAKKPAISVVMPVYNRQNLIHHAIQSIMDQTFDDWELIIIDDGSTDNTENMIKPYLKDKRVRYAKNNHNRGISYSRNRGNKMARGELLVVQDSDDMSLPNRLEVIWNYFQKNPKTDFLYSSFYIRAVDIRYGVRAMHREVHQAMPYDRKRAMTQPYIPGQVAYKRDKALETPYRKEIIAWDDWMLIMDWTMKGYKFDHIDDYLYEYVISDDSITTLSDGNGIRDKDKETLKRILKKEYGINATE